MTIESATYISQLAPANPADSDEIPEGDNHIRLLKSVLQAQFTSLGAAAVTVTAAQLNDIVNKAPLASPPLTGTPTAPTATNGTSTTQIASTAFVQAAIASVNAQTPLTLSVDNSTTISATAGQHIVATNAALVTITLPPSPSAGARVRVTFTNSLFTNVIDPGVEKVFSVAGTRTVNALQASAEFTYANSTIGWVH